MLTEEVDLELRLESLGGDGEGRQHDAGAVDENVQFVVGGSEFGDESFDGFEGEQVHGDEVNVFVGAAFSNLGC